MINYTRFDFGVPIRLVVNRIMDTASKQTPDSIEAIIETVVAAKRTLLDKWPVLIELDLSIMDEMEIIMLQSIAPRYAKLYNWKEEPRYFDLLEYCYKRTIEIRDIPVVHSNLALVYQRKGMPQEALLQALHAVDLEPNNPTTHVILGAIYAQQKQDKEALEQFDAALEIDPTGQETIEELKQRYSLG